VSDDTLSDPWKFRLWILYITDVVSDKEYWPDNWWVDRDRFHQYVYQGA